MRWGISFPVGLGWPRLFLDPETEIPAHIPPERPAPKEIWMLPDNERPKPLTTAATRVAKIWGLVVALIGATSGFGLLTLAQSDAVIALGDQLAPTVTIVGTLWLTLWPLISNVIGAFRTAKTAEPNVTPVGDERHLDEATGKLVPMVPVFRSGRHYRADDTL